MLYQSQDIRGATSAISGSIKYRKACLNEHNSSKKKQQMIPNDENFHQPFQSESKSRKNSIQMKKQTRRKTGAIGKIVRNCQELENRNPLGEADDFLNHKLHFQNENENLGIHKKLYEQNKILNEALKSKIYLNPQSNSYKNSLIDMTDFVPDFKTFSKVSNPNILISEKKSTQKKNCENESEKHLNMKHSTMLAEYDKKRSFIKQEIDTSKKRNSVENYSSLKVPSQQTPKKLNYQYNARQNISANNSRVNYESVNSKAVYFTTEMKKSMQKRKLSEEYRMPNSEDNLIDSKFKAYQQKIEKHKDFEKRYSSAHKFSESQVYQREKKPQPRSQLKSSIMKSLESKNIESTGSKLSETQAMKIFVDLLMKQFQKDEQVRELKNQLKNFSLQEIQKILKQRYSFDISYQILKLSTQEYDPFFVSKQSQTSMDKLAWQFLNAYEIAQNFWKNLIVGRFNSQELEKIYNTLNNSKKNQIELNHLARQLSFHLKKTIRGRQVFQTYRRLTPLTKQNFISKLSKKQQKQQ